MKISTQSVHDPLLLAQLSQTENVEFSSYLICLAAYQRGLSVTFHRTLPTSIFRFVSKLGARGELFSITDGKSRHYFNISVGDKTSIESAKLTKDKHQTKDTLSKAGVMTPEGIVLLKNQVELADEFISTHPNKAFVIKPFNGSNARGVHTNLSVDQVKQVLTGHEDEMLILEEYIKGEEFRVTVVDRKAIAVIQRDAANVIGHSGKTIEELVNEKNVMRSKNVFFRYEPIPLNETVNQYLAAQGLTLKSIPKQDEKIYLSQQLSRRNGADTIDRTKSSSDQLKRIAIQACEAVNLPNAGLDIIVEEHTGNVIVIELNSRAHIAAHTYPLYGEGVGNEVAEAIIDMYFPNSKSNVRHSGAIIFISTIIASLRSGVLSEVTLPTLGENWKHRRFKLWQNFSAQNMQEMTNLLLYHGLYFQIYKVGAIDSYLDISGPNNSCEEFEKFMIRIASSNQSAVSDVKNA